MSALSHHHQVTVGGRHLGTDGTIDTQCRYALTRHLHQGPRGTPRGIFPLPEIVYERIAGELTSTWQGVQPSEEWVGWFMWQLVIDMIGPRVATTPPGRVAETICLLLAVDDSPLDQQLAKATDAQADWFRRVSRISQTDRSNPSGSRKVRIALAYIGRPAGSSFAELHNEHHETAAALWRVVRRVLASPNLIDIVRRRAGWMLAHENHDPRLGAVRPRRRPGVVGSMAAYEQDPLEDRPLDLSWVDEALCPDNATAAVDDDSDVAGVFEFNHGDFFTRLYSASQVLELGLYMTRPAAVLEIVDMADQYPTQRQTCIDLLCLYMRSPQASDPSDRVIDNEARGTIIHSIRNRLLPDATTSWQGCNLNFTGAVIESGDFSHAVFSGGIVYFDDVDFGARWFSFDNALFSGGTVSFTGARFSGEWMSFARTTFAGSAVWYTNAAVANPAGTLTFRGARFVSGSVGMKNLRLIDGCTLDVKDATGCADVIEHAPPRLVEEMRA